MDGDIGGQVLTDALEDLLDGADGQRLGWGNAAAALPEDVVCILDDVEAGSCCATA